MKGLLLISISLMVLLTVLLNACGGDGGNGSSDDTNVGFGWLKISSDATFVSHNDDGAYARVSGTAFTSSSYSALTCAGLCCIFCSFDNSYPGVDVSWTNNTNNFYGTADSRYGTLTDWDHLWSATIPLSVGTNDIDFTAFDPAGNIGNDSVTIDYFPPAPKSILTGSDNSQITLEWGDVWGADFYNIYWSTEPGVTKSNGFMITNVGSPYIHSDLVNGVTYYYVITSVIAGFESTVSTEVSVVAGLPPRPTRVTATVEDVEIIISWDDISTATSYNLYWSNEPDVTSINGTQVANIPNPFIHTDLIGAPYYYIVTGVNNFGEGKASIEVTAMPRLPPPIPTGLEATLSNETIIEVKWNSVPGVPIYNSYRLDRCDVWTIASVPPEAGLCSARWPDNKYWEEVYRGTDTLFKDRNVSFGQAYRYRVRAVNAFGESETSEEIGFLW